MSDEGLNAAARAELLELFVRHTPAAVAMLDCDMTYLMVSHRWLRDHRLAEANVIGKCHYDVFPDTPAPLREAHRTCLDGAAVEPVEIAHTRPDGTTDWHYGEMLPWYGRDGAVGGIVLFNEIVTARKHAEDRLRESHRTLEQRVAECTAALAQAKAEAEAASGMKAWFIGAAGHDLRQPLQASLSYLRVLEQKLERADLKEIAVKARQSLNAMAGILDVLLELGRLESGTIKPHLDDFSLGELVQRVIASCQPQAAIKDLPLVWKGPDCIVRSDPALLERVVTNLVANAVRYTEAGAVTVSCEARDGIVSLSVHDTGIGIPEESIATIFDDYVQVGNAARDRHRGLGLGLSITRRIAQLLGHPIAVQSQMDEGSTFTVEIPQGRANVKRSAAPKDAAASPATLLLVDDDPDVSESLGMLLETFGMQVHVAANGAEALAHIADGVVPDLVLTDYRLPDYDGFEVIARLRAALGKEVPAILITGETALQPTARPDNFALLHKPFDVDDLVTLVEKMRPKPAAASNA